jgi:DNA-binding HxlR family transcriptional regulator
MQNNLEDCPIRNVLSRFGDKWSLLVISALSNSFMSVQDKKMRFNELHKSVDGISQKMLTVTLRTLEADGLVIREVFPQVPPKVEYQLSELGKTLVPHILSLVEWADQHQEEIIATRSKYLV